MLTKMDIEAVNEFTRVARLVYPRVGWEELTTESGKRYLLICDGTVSWFVEPVQALGPVAGGWAVIATHRGDELLYTCETPAGALEGATAKLVACLARVSASALKQRLETDRQMEDAL